jgi:molecular chaperone HtpG
MIEGQDKIYYHVADSWESVRSSPHLEIFRERGIEVLLMHERIDEWMMANVTEYAGKAFQDVARGDLALPGDPATPEADAAESPLAERIAAALGDRVKKVRPSRRLKDSPACLVLGDYDLSPQMRRIMEATGQKLPESKPIFEYNPTHPLVVRLDGEADEDRFREVATILLDQATLAGGDSLADPADYVARLNRLLLALLSD